MNQVIVIGGSHHNTLGVIRALGQKGLSSILILHDCQRSFVAKSRYVADVYYFTRADELICLLNNRILDVIDKKIKHVIICSSDFSSEIIDSNKKSLSKHYYIPTACKAGGIKAIMNKDTMSQLADSVGLRSPENFNLNELNKVLYPCITKPIMSIAGSKNNIFVFSSRDEFESNLNKITCDVQIQEFIEKDIEFQLIGCSLNGGEVVIIPGVTIMIRQPKTTNTGYLKYVPRKDFDADYDKCECFLRACGYSGLFSMEFIKDKKGITYFLEINMRNDGNAYCVTCAGVNLPYIWYEWNINKSITTPTTFDNPIYSIAEFCDFKNVLSHKVSIIKWLKEYKRAKSKMVINNNDIKPFFYYLFYKMLKMLY